MKTFSPLPTIHGAGLTRAESDHITAARNDAEYRGARFADDNADPFPLECGTVAASIALRVVLARRPRVIDPGPDGPPIVVEPFEPSEADRKEWAATSAAHDALARGLTPADLRPVRFRNEIRDEDMARVGAVG